MAYNPDLNIARDEDSYNNLAHASDINHSIPASCTYSGPNEGIWQMNDMPHQPSDFVNNSGHNGFAPSSSFNNNNNPNTAHMAPSYTNLEPPSQPRASAPSLPKTNTSTYGIMPPNPYPFDPTSIWPPVSPSADLYLCKGCYTTVESRVSHNINIHLVRHLCAICRGTSTPACPDTSTGVSTNTTTVASSRRDFTPTATTAEGLINTQGPLEDTHGSTNSPITVVAIQRQERRRRATSRSSQEKGSFHCRHVDCHRGLGGKSFLRKDNRNVHERTVHRLNTTGGAEDLVEE